MNYGSFEGFLKDLGMRAGAAVIVISVFFGLGVVKRTDFLGLAGLLDSGSAFFVAAFGLLGVVWFCYMIYLYYQ